MKKIFIKLLTVLFSMSKSKAEHAGNVVEAVAVLTN